MDQPAQKSELPGSSSFLMDGCVSLVTDPSTKQPIKIWRDSGAFQSLILQDLLPFTDRSKLGSSALVQGFGGGYLSLPMHKLTLETGLVSGEVAVAVCSSLPIKGVSFILGNDLAGGRVLTAPEVVPFPVVSKRPDDLQKPNQKIPSAPLPPIPAIGEPFERILIDCVGPLPRTKSGNRYLLTIMCTATRFPEAIPLRRITASAISKALIKCFSSS